MEREKFGSRFGALVVIAGSAVGLGNIWRFPYMVGANGGAAFILIYIFFCAFICLPIMVSEMLIGRRAKTNARHSFKAVAPDKKRFAHLGILYILTPILVLSYYCVIGGMTISYFFESFGTSLPKGPWWTELWSVIFLLLTGAIVFGGVRKGIERFSKVMMPALFIIVAIIAIYVMTLPSAEGTTTTARDGVAFLFKPDFSKVTGKTFLAALGQAFFSLSLGSGVLLTYGSYVNRKDNLIKSSWQIALSDLIFAIIAGCAVIPAVFALKADPVAVLTANTDSALVFNILPDVFPKMPLGALVGVFFFFALILAALTSSISQFEIPVAYLSERAKISRKASTVIIFSVCLVLMSLCAFRGQFINIFDAICANWLMPIGGLLAVIGVGWVMKKQDVLDELGSDGRYKRGKKFAAVLFFLVRYVAVAGILIVFIAQIFNK